MKNKAKKTIFQIKEAEQKTQYMQVPVEIKLLEDMDDGFFRFEGLASTFGNIDLVDDIVERGAFVDSLSEKMPKILWQHDMFEPIGMPEVAKEVEAGLFVVAKLPKDDTLVKGRVIPQMRVGSITEMSIGFRVKEFSIDEKGIRRLEKVDLKEISLVTFPANPLATVTGFKDEAIEMVGAEKAKEINTKRDFEKCLRESGVFTKDAACILAKFFHGEHENEAKDDGDEDANSEKSEEEIANLKALTALSLKFENTDIENTLTSMFQKLEN